MARPLTVRLSPGERLLDARRRLEAAARAEAEQLEVVWSGALGRQGVALTEGLGLGSSLGPGRGFDVGGLR